MSCCDDHNSNKLDTLCRCVMSKSSRCFHKLLSLILVLFIIISVTCIFVNLPSITILGRDVKRKLYTYQDDSAAVQIDGDGDQTKSCYVGVISSDFDGFRRKNAHEICERIRNVSHTHLQTTRKNATYRIVDCLVWNGPDGKKIDDEMLMRLAQNRDIVLPSRKRNEYSRLGFSGVGSLANAIAHVELANYFLSITKNELNADKSDSNADDCFIQIEDDAEIGEDFNQRVEQLLETLYKQKRKFDVINLNENVDSYYVFGSFTHSIGLLFTGNGLKKFLSAIPVDTNIDLFIEKLVRSRHLYGIRTCDALVSKVRKPENFDGTSVRYSNSIIWNVNQQSRITDADWDAAAAKATDAYNNHI